MVAADLRGDGNVFTIVRCVLALAVVFTHAWGLTASGHDPSLRVLPFPVSRLAVLLFFTLSGFLITGSFMRRGLGAFVAARLLRIGPGLWVMLVVTTLVLGAAFSTVAPAQFFTAANLGHYLVRNMLLIGSGSYELAGVFQSNPAHEVNRSLWSIPLEVRCYIGVIVTGLIGLLTRRHLFLAGLVALLAVDLTPIGRTLTIVPLALSFAAGMAMFLWRDRLYLSWPLALAAIAGGLVLPVGGVAQTVTQLAFAYAVVVAAILVPASWKRATARLPDYSYGIYIYAFPVQQAVVALGIGLTPATNIAWSVVVVFPLAALSWHFVEHPALKWNARRTRRRETEASRAF